MILNDREINNMSCFETMTSFNQVIKRVSDKTLAMKSDQVKLFNRVNNELSLLLSKTQEIIRICLSDRNGIN